jgi:hypothetical protein
MAARLQLIASDHYGCTLGREATVTRQRDVFFSFVFKEEEEEEEEGVGICLRWVVGFCLTQVVRLCLSKICLIP